jgi:hypothetical protein
MSDTNHLFNPQQPITLRLISADGDRSVTVSFPTDEQLERRQRGRKLIIKDLGRGMTDTDIRTNEELDLEIMSEIKREGVEIDGAEAISILDRLQESEVVDVEREGSCYRIHLRVPGIVTEHLLRIPTQREIMDQRRQAIRVISLPHGRREIRTNLKASAELYASLCTERVGYAEGTATPVTHRAAAVNAAISELEREIAQEAQSPEDF